ncbi:hypothetical protein D3C80_1871790 [compost metagenome]
MVEEKKGDKKFTPLKDKLADENVHIIDDRENVFHNRTIQVEDKNTGQTLHYPNVKPHHHGLPEKEEKDAENLPFVPHKHK